jgi:putative endonuclease
MHSSPHVYYVYIMTNRSKTLYTGVTRNLERRTLEHKQGVEGEFCARYKIDRLAYFERFGDIRAAICGKNKSKACCESRKSRLLFR